MFRLEAGGGDAAPVEMLDLEIVFIGKGRNARTDVFRMKTDGSEPVNLTNSPVYDYHSLACSSDGKRIAYVEGGDLQFFHIYSMDLESGDVVQLTTKSGRRSTFGRLTWSPDGRRIALIKAYSFPSQNRYYTEIGIVEADGSGYADLTQTAEHQLNHSEPVWSPDGSQIAFGRYRYTYTYFSSENYEWKWIERGIHVIDTDGNQPFRLVEWGFDPAWSPDGSQIAYVRFSNGDTGISIVDAEGGSPVALTWHSDLDPVWSLDGERIAFVRYGESDAGIHVMSRNGGQSFNLTHGPSREGWPAWSPDGEWIGFHREGDIWAVPASGGDPVNLTNHFEKFIREFRWIP